MIADIVSFLKECSTQEGYYIKEFSNNIYFGVDDKRNYVFARVNSSNDNKVSLSTNTIKVYQNYSFTFDTDKEMIEDNFDVLILDYNRGDTLETFVSLCMNFYDKNDVNSILQLTEDLIQLYRYEVFDYFSQQGLWSELFTIDYLYKFYDVDIAKFWHSDPYNKYDFSFGSDFKLEVKSTLKEYREHEFSHEQIFTNNRVIVSSVMLQKDDCGLTIYDLFNRVESLFNKDYNIYKKLQSEMMKYPKNNLLKFNYDHAISNIKFFSNQDVPKFNSPEPQGVHGTKYLAQLEFTEELSKEQIYSLRSLKDSE